MISDLAINTPWYYILALSAMLVILWYFISRLRTIWTNNYNHEVPPVNLLFEMLELGCIIFFIGIGGTKLLQVIGYWNIEKL